ncbi:helix-turn-helix domain-containing protein [Mycoplasma zalophidermidis]|nr:helix-turn-helix domain-containing protein [Mycoplasma zalophidermidis]
MSKEERFFIQKSFENHMSMRFIARELKRSASSISREIKKNYSFYNIYEHDEADKKSKIRHHHKYMFRFSANFEYEEFTKIYKKIMCFHYKKIQMKLLKK